MVEAAWEAAQDIGLPVALKPTDGNHGRGVTLDLGTREDVEAAYAYADLHGSEVMVERYVDDGTGIKAANQVLSARGLEPWPLATYLPPEPFAGWVEKLMVGGRQIIRQKRENK